MMLINHPGQQDAAPVATYHIVKFAFIHSRSGFTVAAVNLFSCRRMKISPRPTSSHRVVPLLP